MYATTLKNFLQNNNVMITLLITEFEQTKSSRTGWCWSGSGWAASDFDFGFVGKI